MSEASRIEVAHHRDVARARAEARRLMRDQTDGAVAAAELVVTELATNALLHGGGVAALTVTPIAGGVRVEVTDRNRNAPLVSVSSPEAMTGRGLYLVSRLSARWGVAPDPGGKTVWAEVTAGYDAATSHSEEDLIAAWADPIEPSDDPALVHVELGEAPTDLLVAAKRHVDNLVREFMLAASGERSGTTAPVPGPLADLIERVVHQFEDARHAIKRQATEAARAGATHTKLTLYLPAAAADAAERYLDALDAADAYCRANRLLTLETPPQHRVFRRWYIGETVKQLRAAAAGESPPPVVPFEQRILEEIDAAEGARRTAERAARLYTVAAALAAAVTAEEVATAVLREGRDALQASGGGVLVATEADRLAVPATVGYDEPIVERLRQESRDAELPAAYALRTGEAVWLETVEERDARFPALVGMEPDTIAMCAVPLRVADRVLGAMRFSFSERRLFDEDEQRFVLALAAEAAEALDRANLIESEREARRRAEHERASIEKLAAIGEAMLRRRDLDAILQLATDAATQVTGAEFGAFFYNAVDERGESYALYTLSGAPRSAFERFPMPRNTAIFGPTFAGLETMRLDDVTADPRYGKNPPYHGMPQGHLRVRSYMAVPVTLSTGEVAGGLFLGHPEAGRFDEAAERLATGVAGQTAAAIENVRRLEERTRVARTLQQSLLPADLPAIAGIDLGAAYRAAGEGVGGDFYDVFHVGGNRWGIAIGDVRGRGPEAAALTALARYTIRTAVLLGHEPAGVARVLNDAMVAHDDSERFCSAIVAVLEVRPSSAVLTFASAGHPPIAVVRGDHVDFARAAGCLAGVLPGAAFEQRSVELGRGDAVVFYTDGISEARSDGGQFGDAAMVDALEALRGAPSQAVADGLTDAAAGFAGRPASDDAAVFVVTVRG